MWIHARANDRRRAGPQSTVRSCDLRDRGLNQAVAPFSGAVTNTSSTYSLSKSASFLACSRRVPPSRSNPTTALFSAGWCHVEAVPSQLPFRLGSAEPDGYPPYQTCHRRFPQWVHSGVMRGVLVALAEDLRFRGRFHLHEASIDGSFAPAKKKGRRRGQDQAQQRDQDPGSVG